MSKSMMCRNIGMTSKQILQWEMQLKGRQLSSIESWHIGTKLDLHTHILTHTYIKRKKERERERERDE